MRTGRGGKLPGIVGGFAVLLAIAARVAAGPGVSISVSRTPDQPCNNRDYSARLVVTNTGDCDITGLEVDYTCLTNIGAWFNYRSESSPPGFAFDISSSRWARSSLALGPGDALTFTITGNIETWSSQSGDNTETAWVNATTGSGDATGSANSVLSLPCPGLPTPPQIMVETTWWSGGGYGVSLWAKVTNTGDSTIERLTIVDTVPAGSSWCQWDMWNSPEGSAVLWNGLNSGVMAWTGTITLGPGQYYSVSLNGGARDGLDHSSTFWVQATNAYGSAQASSATTYRASLEAVTMEKRVLPTAPRNNEVITYVISIRNDGDMTGYDSVVIVDTLPDEVQFQAEEHQPDGGESFERYGKVLVWRYPWGSGLNVPGAVMTITVTGIVSASATGPVTNEAWLLASRSPWWCWGVGALERSARVTFPLAGISDVAIQTLVASTPRAKGESVSGTIVVRNIGLQPVTYLSISDTLPAEVAWTSQSNNAGLVHGGSLAGLSTWEGPVSLAPGGTATIWLDGTVAACAGGDVPHTVRTTALAAAGTTEYVANGVLGVLPGIPRFYFPWTPCRIDYGASRATWTIRGINYGPTRRHTVSISDTLPAGTSFAGETHPAGLSFTQVGQVVSWDGQLDLAPGEEYAITVTEAYAPSYTGLLEHHCLHRIVTACGSQEWVDQWATDIFHYDKVAVVGGEDGYIEPDLGEQAQIYLMSPTSGTADLRIFNMAGTEVWSKSVHCTPRTPALQLWDCRDAGAAIVPAGVYVLVVTGVINEPHTYLIVIR